MRQSYKQVLTNAAIWWSKPWCLWMSWRWKSM